MIEVASCSIAELFTEKISNTNIQGKLIIPEYQRPYVWKEKEIRKLTNDLFDYFQHNHEFMYYIGSIILHKNDNNLNIIDGQQRITTLAIIQSILDENKVPSINYASPITIKNIKQNHKLLTEILKDKKVDFTKINCTLIVTPNEDDAYTFFETQNTGGIRLSGSDILKAFHLRAIKEKYEERSEFAIKWESQKKVEIIINYLLKARRWNILNFIKVASHRNKVDTKKQLINDFSEQTQNNDLDIAYHQISHNLNQTGIDLKIPLHLYSVRQPLNNGKNFISFVNSFSQIYFDLFLSKKADIPEDFYNFYINVIKQVDGTAYLKEFFEISLLIYVSEFGTSQLLEASLWIFRYSYSLRLSNQKTVREDSIPAFIKRDNYLFDIIISSYTHKDFLIQIERFPYEINKINLENGRNTVKNRFVGKVAEYFQINFNQLREDYDTQLKKAIKIKVNQNG